MITTQALIDAALARGLREKLPREWFQDEHWQCQRCGKALHPIQVTYRETHDSACGGHCVVVSAIPDLTAPTNLYELLRFADAVGSGLCSLNPYLEVDGEWFFSAHIWRRGPVADVADSFNGYGPDRTTAVIAACAKALGLEGAGS